ncbi:MAG: S41 family peptidase [Candidatus Paceibacterota bacterium]|jgi:carboxyl-terminal processing protease
MNSSKRIVSAAVLVVLVGASYFAGFKFGVRSVPAESLVQNVINKDGKMDSVDFATFWKAWKILDDKFSSNSTSSTSTLASSQDRVWGAIKGMTESLGDPYTVFFPPAEAEIFKSEIAGSFSGVGMEVGIKDGKLSVVSPIKGSPAEAAGVKAGDFIVRIDDVESLSMSTDRAVKLIRGKSGTSVKLTLARDGIAQPFVLSIIRDIIDIPTLKTDDKDGIFTISLYSFSASSANLFRNALKEFVDSGDTKLVLDLRGNPGGYLDAAVDMASWFLPTGKMIVREESQGKAEDKEYRSKGYDIFTDKLRMVILVDGGSASASEILAGALSEQGVAKLVGAKTFGKGSVQELVPITSDTSLKVTVARWLTPNGRSISHEGITPDYVVPVTDADIKAKKDPQMAKAVEILNTVK